MLRTVVKQLSNVLSVSGQRLPETVTSTQKVCFHASGIANANLNNFDRSRDLVRQKGIEVTRTTDSQQVAFNSKPHGNVSFASLETFQQSFDGVPFHQLPIIHIKATSNNTIVSVTNGDGVVLGIQSAGTVGFRNARKGTNVAAQAAAIALADDALRKEIKQARVCIRGIGPGRFPALKAIEMSGIKVISISDTTPLAHNGNRPKKVRRL